MERAFLSMGGLNRFLILCVLVVGGWFLSSSTGLELRINPVKGGDPLLVAPLETGERFTLQYIHSVDREPIWEVHSVDSAGQIFIEEERFIMVGAGMGELPGRGHWTGNGELQAIQDMHYLIGEFVLRIGSPGVDHTVFWRNTQTNLSTMAAGTAVLVTAYPVKQYYSLWRRLVPHAATPQSGAADVRSTSTAE